jgi:hypothetical protein
LFTTVGDDSFIPFDAAPGIGAEVDERPIA